MSAAEELVPEPRKGPLLTGPDEVAKARAEDPDFEVTLAKARARARNETYNPERHGPHKPVPIRKRDTAPEPIKQDGNLSEVIARFLDKGSKSRIVAEESDHQPKNPYLRALK